MKLIIYFGLLIILSLYVYADSIEIKLIQYEPDSTHARIQIRNIEQKSYHNLTIAIDNTEPSYLVAVLFPGNAVVHSRNINPGLHNISLKTNEGVNIKKEILFTKSLADIKSDAELKNLNATKENKTDDNLNDETDIPEKKKGNLGKIIFGIILLLFIISGFVFWYVNYGPKRTLRQIFPRPIQVQPARLEPVDPIRMRMVLEERAKRRQQILEGIMRK